MNALLLLLFTAFFTVPTGTADAPAIHVRAERARTIPQPTLDAPEHPEAHRYLQGLLGLFQTTPTRSRIPLRTRLLIEAHRATIERNAQASLDVHGVPIGVILAIAFQETHLGTDRYEGGGWGAPISPNHRNTAGTPMHAARALATSYERCGHNWQRAVSRFQSGLCVPIAGFRGALHRTHLQDVTGLVRRLYASLGEPLPSGFDVPLASR